MTTDQRVTPEPRDVAHSADPARVEGTTGAAWLVLLLVGIAGFVALTYIVASRIPIVFDAPLLAMARAWGAWSVAWRDLSESANIPLVVIGLGMVAWLFFTKRRREALVVLVLLIAVTAGSEGVKQLVARPRPSGTDPNIPGVVYSFPSGHELEVLTIWGIIAIRCWRNLKNAIVKYAIVLLVTVEVILVAVARVALSAHYPSDVLAGFFGGLAALGAYGWLTRPGGFADSSPEPERRNP
jgi:membrane-associated phospholipid phosphatase